MATSTTTQREAIHRPWDKWPSTIDVPAAEWGWCFDLRQGTPRVLLQPFQHKRDTDGLSFKRTTKGPRENPHNYPVIPFSMVTTIFDRSQNEEISHRKLFLALYERKKLSAEDIEILATAPDIFTAGEKEEVVAERDAERQARAKAFLDEVDQSVGLGKAAKTAQKKLVQQPA